MPAAAATGTGSTAPVLMTATSGTDKNNNTTGERTVTRLAHINEHTDGKMYVRGKTADLGCVEKGRHRDRKAALVAHITTALGELNTHLACNVRIVTIGEDEFFVFEVQTAAVHSCLLEHGLVVSKAADALAIKLEDYTWNQVTGNGHTFRVFFVTKKTSDATLLTALRSQHAGVTEVAQRRTVTRHGLGTFDVATILVHGPEPAQHFAKMCSMMVMGASILFVPGTGSFNSAVDNVYNCTATLHAISRFAQDGQLQPLLDNNVAH